MIGPHGRGKSSAGREQKSGILEPSPLLVEMSWHTELSVPSKDKAVLIFLNKQKHTGLQF